MRNPLILRGLVSRASHHARPCCFSSSPIRPGMMSWLKWAREVRSQHKLLKWTDIEMYRQLRRKVHNAIANQYYPERIVHMGPDFACLEWLMNAGSTSILMSDGTLITSQKEMRKFLLQQGFDVRRKIKTEAPSAHLLKSFEKPKSAQLASDLEYNERWRHISPIHMKEVDASDSFITDRGFKYFLECRNIEKMKLNFCGFFGDEAIATLAQGRPGKTLKELEITFNPHLTDSAAYLMIKFKALRRLHLYFLPYTDRRAAVLRQLKIGLPYCKVTFPETFFIGMGYETEEEKAAYQKTHVQKGFFSQFFK